MIAGLSFHNSENRIESAYSGLFRDLSYHADTTIEGREYYSYRRLTKYSLIYKTKKSMMVASDPM